VATGREAVNPAGDPIPASPLSLVVEFLDGSGQVIGSEELSLPALEPGTDHELRVRAEGPNIESWRYRRK
jgi:hypothetical protein